MCFLGGGVQFPLEYPNSSQMTYLLLSAVKHAVFHTPLIFSRKQGNPEANNFPPSLLETGRPPRGVAKKSSRKDVEVCACVCCVPFGGSPPSGAGVRAEDLRQPNAGRPSPQPMGHGGGGLVLGSCSGRSLRSAEAFKPLCRKSYGRSLSSEESGSEVLRLIFGGGYPNPNRKPTIKLKMYVSFISMLKSKPNQSQIPNQTTDSFIEGNCSR